MTMTPVVKGQITKALKMPRAQAFSTLRKVFEKHMPKEQAKHATRRLLAA